MENYGYALILVLTELPTFAVLVVAAVLTHNARDRVPERVRHLLLAGLGALLLSALLTTGWSAGARVSFSGFGPLFFLGGLLRVLLVPVGVGLLVAAALAGRRPGEPRPAGPALTTPPPHAPQPPTEPR
ncbi:hypothetical protein [Micromonospora lutea]|uniref:Uncharacterized protein n=1 Tax=Micromonospora lutea TaxID=419825 RepID=A0ABQ4IZF3_9ACTN|nr:hypothetical protein [Micromonospora lutea]GIJ23306.1 hypothetical protein Vlu01_39300 [Micromonospora lutea]